MSYVVHIPSLSKTLSDTRLAFTFTPWSPAFVSSPPITPATSVPWPLSSFWVGVCPTKSYEREALKLLSKSVCVGEMPVSSMATETFDFFKRSFWKFSSQIKVFPHWRETFFGVPTGQSVNESGAITVYPPRVSGRTHVSSPEISGNTQRRDVGIFIIYFPSPTFFTCTFFPLPWKYTLIAWISWVDWIRSLYPSFPFSDFVRALSSFPECVSERCISFFVFFWLPPWATTQEKQMRMRKKAKKGIKQFLSKLRMFIRCVVMK